MGKDNSPQPKSDLKSHLEHLNHSLLEFEKDFTNARQELKRLELQHKFAQTLLTDYQKSILSIESNIISSTKTFEQYPETFGLVLKGNDCPYILPFLNIAEDDFEAKAKICKQVSDEIFEYSKKFIENSLIELNKQLSTVKFNLKSCSGCICSGIRCPSDFNYLSVSKFVFTIEIS